MKVAGFRRRSFSAPSRASIAQPAKRFLDASNPWTSAIASTALKPTLCRFIAYLAPGLPRPTQRCISRYFQAEAVLLRKPEPRAASGPARGPDRKDVVSGKTGSVSVDLGCRRIIKKN